MRGSGQAVSHDRPRAPFSRPRFPHPFAQRFEANAASATPCATISPRSSSPSKATRQQGNKARTDRARHPAHAWGHPVATIGSLGEVADAAAWDDADTPGVWTPGGRIVRKGPTETWGALAGVAGPSGPARPVRALIATTDLTTLPALATWELVTNLSAPQPQPQQPLHPAADLAEIVRLYGLRTWVEQRAWLEPWMLRTRGWQAWSDQPPPPALRALLAWLGRDTRLTAIPFDNNPPQKGIRTIQARSTSH